MEPAHKLSPEEYLTWERQASLRSESRTSSTKFAYSDVVIVCGEPEFLNDKGDVVTNPTIIFEILSPNTESYDQGDKFADYQQRASLCATMI